MGATRVQQFLQDICDALIAFKPIRRKKWEGNFISEVKLVDVNGKMFALVIYLDYKITIM